jgi:hypothetical protein
MIRVAGKGALQQFVQHFLCDSHVRSSLILQRYLCWRLRPTDNDRYIVGIAVIIS